MTAFDEGEKPAAGVRVDDPPTDAEAFYVESIPATRVQKGDEVVTASGLGSIRKTVFSITTGTADEGIVLNFTDADSLYLPVQDSTVLRVAARSSVCVDEDTCECDSCDRTFPIASMRFGAGGKSHCPECRPVTPEMVETAYELLSVKEPDREDVKAALIAALEIEHGPVSSPPEPETAQ